MCFGVHNDNFEAVQFGGEIKIKTLTNLDEVASVEHVCAALGVFRVGVEIGRVGIHWRPSVAALGFVLGRGAKGLLVPVHLKR